ncbi:MAG: branched-chain amino acid ABC transporter permease, partial [Leptospiraceae bacterium]|nr:branched-chain amino acid ABC transporter permease [Leptospiraceae bacterium]
MLDKKMVFLQILINNLILCSVYSLMSLGFSLYYYTTGVFNLAYATIFMISPYFLLLFFSIFSIPLYISIILSLILTILIALSIEYLIYLPLMRKKASLNISMISSIGVMIILVNLVILIFGNESKIIDTRISESNELGGLIFSDRQLIQLITSILIIIIYHIIIKYTQIGLRIRAINFDYYLSQIFGLNSFKYQIYVVIISSVLAFSASILIAIDVGMDPYVGMPVFLFAVVAMIIGGNG